MAKSKKKQPSSSSSSSSTHHSKKSKNSHFNNCNNNNNKNDEENNKTEKRFQHQKKNRKSHSRKMTVSDVDFQKLDHHLRSMGLYLHRIEGDGNCLFRSVADQLVADERRHMEFRDRCVRQMRLNRSEFEPFILFGGGGSTAENKNNFSDDSEEEERDFEAYCDRMARNGSWGGNLELVAISQVELVHIVVHQLDAPKFEIACPFLGENSHTTTKNGKTIHVSYHLGEHYNSVRALNDRVLQIHNSRIGGCSSGGGSGGSGGMEMEKKVKIVLDSVLPTVEALNRQQWAGTNNGKKKYRESDDDDSGDDNGMVVVVDESYVKKVLQEHGMDVDTAIDVIILEQQQEQQRKQQKKQKKQKTAQKSGESENDHVVGVDDDDDFMLVQNEVYLSQMREYLGDALPDHIILEALKNNGYSLDLTVEQLMNQPFEHYHDYGADDHYDMMMATSADAKSGGGDGDDSKSSSSSSSSSNKGKNKAMATAPKMTKREKKELKRHQKMKERAAEIMEEARRSGKPLRRSQQSSDDNDGSDMMMGDFDLSDEELAKLISQATAVRI